MTDRHIAEAVYSHMGIPVDDWDAHFRVDSNHRKLRKNVRKAYVAILVTL